MARYRLEKRERCDARATRELALQHILQQMLAHNKPIHLLGEATSSTLQGARAQFIEVVRLREQLLMEKRLLSETIAHQEQRVRSIQTMVHRTHCVQVSESDPFVVRSDDNQQTYEVESDDFRMLTRPVEPERTANGCWLQFLKDEPPVFYEYETVETCTAIILQGLCAIQKVCNGPAQPAATILSVQCLGWNAERTRNVDPSTGRPRFRMRCSKRIPRSRGTLHELQSKTWHFVNSPELIAQVNYGSVTAVVVQQLTDDMLILLRNSSNKTNHKNYRYFSLNARLWSSDGATALVAMITFEKQVSTVKPLPVQWMKHGGSCFRFSHVGNNETEIELTNFTDCLTEEHAMHLMIAKCSALLKWEHLVVPPNLLF